MHAWELAVLRKRETILDVFCEISEVLQNLIFTENSLANASDIQQHFGHITCSVSNKSVCLGPPQRAVRKQFTVFVSKIFKITKVEGNIFCGWGRLNEQKRVFSKSSHADVFCKNSVMKYLAKLTAKHLCRSFL